MIPPFYKTTPSIFPTLPFLWEKYKPPLFFKNFENSPLLLYKGGWGGGDGGSNYTIYNIEIKDNQQPDGNIHFNITNKTSNAEIQNPKMLLPNQTIKQQIHAPKVIDRRLNYTNTKSKSTNRNYTRIYKSYSSKAVRRSKKMEPPIL